MTGARVDLELPCTVCGTPNFGGSNHFVLCDGCDKGFHLICAGGGPLPPNEEAWWCPSCRKGRKEKKEEDGGAKAPPPRRRERVLQEVATPKVDKSARLRRLGLEKLDGEHATRAQAEALWSLATTEETKKAKARVQRRWLAEIKAQGRRPGPEALQLYATTRVLQGLAASTVMREIGMILNMNPDIVLPPNWTATARRAIERAAVPTNKAKDAITAAEVAALMDAAETRPRPAQQSQEEADRLQLRDITFLAVAMASAGRGMHLLALEWDHLRRVWEHEDGRDRAATFGAVGVVPKAKVGGTRITFVESKTDQAGVGRSVDLDYDPSNPRCPTALLLKLHAARRPGQLHVFAELRDKYVAKALSARAMRTRLKGLAKLANLDPARIDRLGLHSLRKGGVTTAREEGATHEQARDQGHWVKGSTAFNRYSLVRGKSKREFAKKVTAAVAKAAGKG